MITTMMIKFSIPERLNLLAHKIISTCFLRYISNKLLFPVGTTQHCNARIKEDLLVRYRNWVKIWQLFDSLIFTFNVRVDIKSYRALPRNAKELRKKNTKSAIVFIIDDRVTFLLVQYYPSSFSYSCESCLTVILTLCQALDNTPRKFQMGATLSGCEL